jgi:hypothetical protein
VHVACKSVTMRRQRKPAKQRPQARRKRVTVPAELSPTGKAFTAEQISPHTFVLPRDVADAMEASEAEAKAEMQEDTPIGRAIRDGLRSPPRATDAAPTALAAGALGPKARLAADTVLKLWGEGFRWGDRETLLREVRARTCDKGLSLGTLKAALRELRKLGRIDY